MRRHRRAWLALIATLWLGVGGWIGLDCIQRPYFISGPMVQMPEPNAFTLLWQLDPPRTITLRVTDSQNQPVASVQLTDGRAVVTDLKPGQDYRYEMIDSTEGEDILLHADTVRTAPPPGTPFRFLAFGDTGDGGPDQYRVARLLPEYQVDLIVHTGDLVYSVGAAEDYIEHFYRPYAGLLARVPFYPTLGNHDYMTAEGQPFVDAFDLPRNGPRPDRPEREYWFDYGDVRFVALDSNIDGEELGRVIAPWLDGVLADAGNRWKVVYFHEPVYTSGRYIPSEKIELTVLPIIEKHGVQLVLTGHNHGYERTHPVRAGGAALDGRGSVHVTTAGGGAGLYASRWPVPEYMAAWYYDRHSFTIVDVTADRMRIRQINDQNTVIDEFVIAR